MKNYFKLIKKSFKRNYSLYHYSHETYIIYLLSIISYIVTPLFLILKIKANTITFINFIIAILSLLLIFSSKYNYFITGIALYFLFRVFDFCDGNVARINNQATFYGRFLDATLDIFYESFFILAISFYYFKIFKSEEILLLGIISSIFTIYSTCIHDKYASLIRWMNEENKTNYAPYLRQRFFSRLSLTLIDINHLTLICFFIFSKDTKVFKILFITLFISYILTSLINLLKHFFYASQNLRFKAGDKKKFLKKKNKI